MPLPVAAMASCVSLKEVVLNKTIIRFVPIDLLQCVCHFDLHATYYTFEVTNTLRRVHLFLVFQIVLLDETIVAAAFSSECPEKQRRC